MKAPRVTVDIDELVLEGIDTYSHARIAETVEKELARLIVKEGAPSTPRSNWIAEPIRTESFEVRPGSGSANIGRGIAQAIYGGLKR